MVFDRICVENFQEEKTVTFSSNNTINLDKTVRYTVEWLPPFIFAGQKFICGPFIGIIQELSKQFDYRYFLIWLKINVFQK